MVFGGTRKLMRVSSSYILTINHNSNKIQFSVTPQNENHIDNAIFIGKVTESNGFFDSKEYYILA